MGRSETDVVRCHAKEHAATSNEAAHPDRQSICTVLNGISGSTRIELEDNSLSEGSVD